MCGIFAFIQRGTIGTEQRQECERYFDRIQHRGPDHSSTVTLEHSGCTVFLGFHRLAIIDPSPESDTILSDDGVYVVCNGEIYNYRYLIKKYNLPVKTGSDCEVILQLYRTHRELWREIVQELDGVFAFVLYDHNNGELYAARDRIGVRPLFYGASWPAKSPSFNSWSFSSEGKGIPHELSRQFRPGTLEHYKLYDGTIRCISTVVWSTLSTSPCYHMPYTTAQGIVRELFTEAVRKRLHADRPIGFLVSGGLDSSLVAAVAHKLLGTRIVTFSIGLTGSPDLIAARKVAKFLDSDHHEVVITVEDILSALPQVVKLDESYDVTTIRASIPMYLIGKYIRENTDIKVVFSGEGADELFGGYLYFHKAPSYAEFATESLRLMKDLHMYDVLRGDRVISAWGLELRVPFLDADFINFVLRLDPAHKMPSEHKIEKAIMRHAFDGYLPNAVLYRQKEAFSDGVGYSSVGALKAHASAEKREIDQTYKDRITGHQCASPETDEARLYCSLFMELYGDRPGLYTRYYWMPKWHTGVTDPSATVLDTHSGPLTE